MFRLLKTMPLFRLLAIGRPALLARRHLRRLDADDRHRLIELLRKGRRMSAGERDQLRAILAKLGPGEFAYSTANAFSPVSLPRRGWRRSPAERARGALEGPDEVARDPPAVEVAVLRVHALVVHPSGVHPAGVERDVIAYRLVARGRIRERPGDRPDAATAHRRVEVARCALELAPRRARAAFGEEVAADVGRREVDRRGMARLEHAQGARRVGDHLAAELDPDVPPTRANRRRARVVPDALHTWSTAQTSCRPT